MEAETILNLLDSYWYDVDFFKRKPKPYSSSSKDPSFESNPEIPSLPTIQTKIPPNSQQRSDSASPNSVLFTPRLQTIFTGKELKDLEEPRAEKEFQQTPKKASPLPSPSSPSALNKGTIGMRRKKKGLSKSLSELEFQEVKGFMDLGFVFSEEDKDSTLASIIPGLQRFDRNKNGDSLDDTRLGVSRPYLSESWEVLERKKMDNSLLNWKVPASSSTTQIDMKGYLKFWAHTVASTYK